MTADVSLVAALDRRNAIGRGNALPWRLPDDLKRFKTLTRGKSVLMGRKTAQSLGRALPDRQNLVLTRSGSVPFEGMLAVSSIEMARALSGDGELMVIGGGEVYVLAMPLATRMYLTHLKTQVEAADAFFPQWDAAEWEATFSQLHEVDNQHAFEFKFVDYRRRLHA